MRTYVRYAQRSLGLRLPISWRQTVQPVRLVWYMAPRRLYRLLSQKIYNTVCDWIGHSVTIHRAWPAFGCTEAAFCEISPSQYRVNLTEVKRILWAL